MKTCKVCYASIPDDASVCPVCGAATDADANAADTNGDRTTCPQCGAQVASGKKFCPQCGEKLAPAQKPAKEEHVEEKPSSAETTCPRCGAQVASGKKFCPQCGEKMPNAQNPADAKTEQQSAVAKKPLSTAGKVKQILPTAGIALTLLLTVIFMFVPSLKFTMSAFGQSESIKHGGVTGLAVLFSGKSDFIAVGAKEITMRLIGAGYIALILVMLWYILFAVSSILKYDKKTAKSNIILNAALTVVSLFIMIMTIVAKGQVLKSIADDGMSLLGIKTSWFMGGVALFIINAIMLVYAIVMRILYKPELDRKALTPNLLGKKVRTVLMLVDALAVVACVVVPIVTGCSGSGKGVGASPDKAKELKSSDTVTLKCDQSLSSVVGVGYYSVGYLVYTPSRNGELEVSLSVDGESEMREVGVGIDEYSDVQEVYSKGGNLPIIMNYIQGESDNIRVTAGEKYCVVFGAVSVTENDKISFSYSMTFTADGETPSGDGSSRNNAITITLDNAVSTGTVNSSSSKWYKYTPSESGYYVISTSAYSGDPDLRIYVGSSISYFDSDSSSDGFTKRISLTAGTTYYFEIYNGGSCTFSLAKLASGTSAADSQVVTLNADAAQVVLDGNNIHWLKFSPEKSGFYHIVFHNSYDGNYVTDYVVIGGSGNNYVSPEEESRYSYGVSRRYRMSAGYDYYVKAYSLTGSSSSNAAIEITGGNNTKKYANSISFGDEYPIKVNSIANNIGVSYSQYYYYKYTPTSATSHVYAELKNGTSSDAITLYSQLSGSDSLSQVTNVNGTSVIDRTLTAGTTYYFRVYKYSSGVATFAIRDGSEPVGSSFDSAEAIENTFVNKTVALDRNGSYYYKLTVSETGIYRLKSTRNGSYATSYTVYNSSKSQIASGASTRDLTFSATSGQTYYIKVTATTAVSDGKFMVMSPSEYKIFVTDVGTGSVGSTMTVSTWPTEKVKAFNITVSETGVYNLNLTQGSVNIKLYDGEYNQLYATISSTSLFGDFRLSANTTYVVVVSSSSSNTNATSLMLTQKSVLSNNVVNAQTVSIGAAVSFSRYYGNSTYYKFTAPSAGDYRIYTSGSVNGDPDIYVYDESYNLIDSDTSSSGFDVELSLQAGDVVYIEVYAASTNNTSTCAFLVATVAENGTAQTALSVTSGQTISTGVISQSSSNKTSKWYKFTPTRNANYTFSFTAITGDPDVYIYSSLGSTSNHDNAYKKETGSGTSNFTITASLTSGTTYYIEIYGYEQNSSCTMTIN